MFIMFQLPTFVMSTVSCIKCCKCMFFNKPFHSLILSDSVSNVIRNKTMYYKDYGSYVASSNVRLRDIQVMIYYTGCLCACLQYGISPFHSKNKSKIYMKYFLYGISKIIRRRHFIRAVVFHAHFEDIH